VFFRIRKSRIQCINFYIEIFEVPWIQPFAPPDNLSPFTILEDKSILLKVLVLMIRRHYLTCQIQGLKDNKIGITPIPLEHQFDEEKKHELKLLSRGISIAYSDILIGISNPSVLSGTAALIAKNKGAYQYWSSFGMVHSAGDLLQLFRRRTRTSSIQNTSNVISGGEEFKISINHANLDNFEEIPLEYALAVKKFEFLGKNDALKVGLLQACKRWGMTLRCEGFSKDRKYDDITLGKDDKMSIVYPLAADKWVLDSLLLQGKN
jgi:hypothetical protein